MKAMRYECPVALEPAGDSFLANSRHVTGLEMITIQQIVQESCVEMKANHAAHYDRGPNHLVDDMAKLQGELYACHCDESLPNRNWELECRVSSHNVRATILPGIYRDWGATQEWRGNHQISLSNFMFF